MQSGLSQLNLSQLKHSLVYNQNKLKLEAKQRIEPFLAMFLPLALILYTKTQKLDQTNLL